MPDFLRQSALICSVTDDDAQGAGGGGDAAEKPMALTQKDIQNIASTIVNGAITNRVLPKLEERFAKYDELLKQISTSTPEPQDKKTPDAAPADERYAAMTKKMEALEKQVAEERALREKAEAKERDARRDDMVKAALLANGIDPVVADDARALVLRSCQYTDDGQVVFTTNDPIKPHVALEDGIKTWANTPTGQRFRPARDVAGSGNRGGDVRSLNGNNRVYSDADLGAMLASRSD